MMSSTFSVDTSDFSDLETTCALALSGVTKRYGTTAAVYDLDLFVGQGEVCALVGPSGCGKTTTLRLIAGFDAPDSGTVQIGDRLVVGERAFVAPEARHVGMVFQEYALFPHMTVAKNVAYGLKRKERDGVRVGEMLSLVGLSDCAERRPSELSGGQQQRVALARALAPCPDLLLLDEPFSNLDAALRNRVRQEVRKILKETGVTTLLVTHDQEEALSLADRVAVMNEGSVVQVGTPEEVYGTPKGAWVASFLGDANVLSGTAASDGLECEFGTVPIAAGFTGPADVLIRPESIALGALGASPSDSANVPGTVIDREFYGHDQIVTVKLPSGQAVKSRRLGFPAWHPGDRVHVWLDGPVTVLARDE